MPLQHGAVGWSEVYDCHTHTHLLFGWFGVILSIVVCSVFAVAHICVWKFCIGSLFCGVVRGALSSLAMKKGLVTLL